MTVPANERAYAFIKDGLIDGTFTAGTRISVDKVSETLGTSKQPVMESLRRLSAEGYVMIVPQVGCRVNDHDAREVRDYFHLFAAVEGAAAALAAERRSSTQLAEAREISAQIGLLRDESSKLERGERYKSLNRDLHSSIHRMSGTPIVESSASGMYFRADFYIYGRSSESPLADEIAARHEDHEGILEAIEAGKVELSRTRAAQHILDTVKLIETDGETAPAGL
jgi:DNA-binding GntR family transcriptional regulator